MLMELAIGDAYGAGFEYTDRDFIAAHNDMTGYVQHPRHGTPPGWYTDDAQMSLAIAEAVLSGEEWTPLMLANKFVECFKRDPHEGYAERFYAFLQSVKDGEHFLKEIVPISDKSGAAMRAAPIGVYQNAEIVMDRTTIQAKLTHDTPDGINASLAAALMTHYFLYRHGPKHELGKYIEKYVPGNWSEPWQGKVKAKGWMSVRAAITAVVSSDRMSDLLRNCINFTGDVDTVATIALAAASCSDEIAQDLPDTLIWQLENRIYGRDYIIALDKQLLALVR